MICPVCEHQQDFGVECEVCGRELGAFAGLGAPPVATQAIEGLEVTLAQPLGEVPVERFAELEVTRFATGKELPAEAMQELERNGSDPVGTVAAERMPGIDEDRVADDGVRTEAPTGPVTCRYCRNVQAEGLLCDRCGMRLPKVAEVILEGTIVGEAGEEAQVRCKACGARGKAGHRCSECGASN